MPSVTDFVGTWDSLDHGPVDTHVRIAWSPTAPAELTFSFTPVIAPNTTTLWIIGRDLIIRALTLPGEHGEGDVCAATSTAHLMLVLDGHEDGIASMRLPRPLVEAFVARTVRYLPPAEEGAVYAATLDAELADLLGGAA